MKALHADIHAVLLCDLRSKPHCFPLHLFQMRRMPFCLSLHHQPSCEDLTAHSCDSHTHSRMPCCHVPLVASLRHHFAHLRPRHEFERVHQLCLGQRVHRDRLGPDALRAGPPRPRMAGPRRRAPPLSDTRPAAPPLWCPLRLHACPTPFSKALEEIVSYSHNGEKHVILQRHQLLCECTARRKAQNADISYHGG